MGGELREWKWRVPEGATEGCANGSSSTGMTNSTPGVGDKHVVTLEGSMAIF